MKVIVQKFRFALSLWATMQAFKDGDEDKYR